MASLWSLKETSGIYMLDYICKFCEWLHVFAKESSQSSIKPCYDRIGDKVLALLSVLGSALAASFLGSYEICDRLVTLIMKFRVCHINMLKPFHIQKSHLKEPGSSFSMKHPVDRNRNPRPWLCWGNWWSLALIGPQQTPRLSLSESVAFTAWTFNQWTTEGCPVPSQGFSMFV